MRVWRGAWWRGGGGGGAAGWGARARWGGALLAWSALCVLALPRLAPHSPAPPRARALLQLSTPAPSPAATSASPPPAPPVPDQLDEEALRAEAARRMPSLPLDYWHRHQRDKGKFLERADCAPLPSVYELSFQDTYWQSMRADNDSAFHLYGAYLDVRNTSRIGPAVRLLAVHDRIRPALVTHCQLWFEGRAAPVVVRTLEYKYVWNSKWGNYRDRVWQPYLVACVLPAAVRAERPAAVSLVRQPCDRATNLLRVQYDPVPPGETQRDFAVCVKGLDFLHEDLSLRLVEWLELLGLLGAREVHFYKLQVHPNVARVLDYYARRGLATVTPVTLPGGQPNLPALQHLYLKKKTTNKRQMELIPYNDCLYRHMYRYRWLALLDVDEVIVPLQDEDWAGLLHRVLPLAAPPPGKPARSSFHASNLYYLDALQAEQPAEESVPSYMHMLSHVWRTRNFTRPGQYVKAFHETSRVLALHNHFPLACLGGACSTYPVSTELARLQHYRADCVSSLSKVCAELRARPVRDAELWRWRDRLVKRVDAALVDLRMHPLHSAAKPAPAHA